MTARHPTPAVLAKQARLLAARLEDEGTKAIAFAHTLADRGYPTNTGGGPRSSDTTSSTERAALTGAPTDPANGEPWHPGQFDGIDQALAHALTALDRATLTVNQLLTRILAHASDDDPIPPGTGSCRRCETFCRPTGDRPEYRIRSGYCPACYRRWLRLGKPDRSAFERSEDAA